MADPKNPLDQFSTYTYHFELHCAKDWNTLKKLESIDLNAETERSRCNGTLIINTRKDAHQTIDDVKFDYMCPVQNQYGQFTPQGSLTMVVTEPGGAQFIEKINAKFDEYQMTNLASLMFGLKIFFVGRNPDNSIISIPLPGIIPLVYEHMEATFTYKGGEYHLKFGLVSASLIASGTSQGSPSNLSGVIAYCNRDLTIKALTVKEALKELECKLNTNYENVYKTELCNSSNARKIKYFINVDPEIDGKLSLTTKESWAPDEKMMIGCDPSQTILTWIYNICRSSDCLNQKVGESINGIRKEDHPGVNLINVTPRMLMKDDVVELHYDVYFYKGGVSEEDLYVFDFMFSDPGKNVDVMAFDIHMNNVDAWFANKSSFGVTKMCNTTSKTPIEDPKAYACNMSEDVTKEKLGIQSNNKSSIPAKSGDVAALSFLSRNEKAGMNMYEQSAVPSARLMFSTIVETHGAVAPQLTFTIRGHLSLLERGILYPDIDGRKYPAGCKSPTQIKVNIKSPDVGHPPFFYTGKYMLISISNTFSGGRFSQQLTVQMQTKEQQT